MEAILDAPLERGGNVTIQDVYNKLEKELYTSRLTHEEKERKLKEIELAVANEKENIQHLEEGLDNALTMMPTSRMKSIEFKITMLM